jgi:hypothetical protein
LKGSWSRCRSSRSRCSNRRCRALPRCRSSSSRSLQLKREGRARRCGERGSGAPDAVGFEIGAARGWWGGPAQGNRAGDGRRDEIGGRTKRNRGVGDDDDALGAGAADSGSGVILSSTTAAAVETTCASRRATTSIVNAQHRHLHRLRRASCPTPSLHRPHRHRCCHSRLAARNAPQGGNGHSLNCMRQP